MRPPAHIGRAIAQQADIRLATQHQAFICALPCTACGKPPPSECAQVGFHRGMGAPTDDCYAVPLCGPASVWEDCCHSRKHFFGSARFWVGLGIDPTDLAFRLWRVSGDVVAGDREVRRARQAIAAAPRDRAQAIGQVRSPRRAQPCGSQSSSQRRPRAAALHTHSEVDRLLERV